MAYEEEAELLEQFIHEADGGHITDVLVIKIAYDEKIGHGQIYYVLHCHDWSKKPTVKQTPEKHSAGVYRGLKKLTPESMN